VNFGEIFGADTLRLAGQVGASIFERGGGGGAVRARKMGHLLGGMGQWAAGLGAGGYNPLHAAARIGGLAGGAHGMPLAGDAMMHPGGTYRGARRFSHNHPYAAGIGGAAMLGAGLYAGFQHGGAVLSAMKSAVSATRGRAESAMYHRRFGRYGLGA